MMNWEQLKTILWLRWRLSRNQWTRSRGLGAVIAIVVGIGSLVLGGFSFLGGWAGGAFALRDAPASAVRWVWFGIAVGFGFFWLLGLVAELQRSETIDLQRLMHLPVALGQMFVINYLASHLALSIVIAVPGMLGLTLGLAMSRGPLMVLLAPLALTMVFMITAWTYCLRGWLAALMANPRRRRTVIMVITLTFVLLGQAPNLYFNVFHRLGNSSPGQHATSETPRERRETRNAAEKKMFDQLLAAEKLIPPLWVAAGAGALAENHPLPALAGTLGCAALGALGLRRAYRTTLRFYYGQTDGKAAAKLQTPQSRPATGAPSKAGVLFLERRLPGVPEQAAALALATFRSMLRAPEVKMAWGTSLVVALILGATLLFRPGPTMPSAAKPFVGTAAVVFSLFTLIQFLANQFGFDRDGFRVLVLSPADRRLILLGKNLASLPAVGLSGVLLLTLSSIWIRLPPLTVAAAFFQLVAILLFAGMGGNLLSILAPYRIQPGSMKPTKMPGATMLVIMLCQLLFPFFTLPVFLPPLAELLWQAMDLPGGVPVNLLLSAALAALAVFAYWQTLEPLGRLLYRRETKILGRITEQVE